MACFTNYFLNFAEKYMTMDKNNKNLLKVIAFFGTIIIIFAVFAWISYSDTQKANEQLDKSLEEVWKYNSEQQQKEAEERLNTLHNVLSVDAEREGNE